MVCLHCGQKIGVLRKLQDDEFCSAAHRKAYKKKLEDLAVDFLMQSKPRARPQVAGPPATPPAPAEPKPILVLAEFLPEGVAARRMDLKPLRNAEPTRCPAQTELPADACVTTARVRVSSFAPMAVKPSTAVGCMESARACAVEFGSERPRLRTRVARPVWIEPASQASPERRRAAFATYRPAWVQPGREIARSGAVAQFSSETGLIPVLLAAARPAFRLAGSSRPSFPIARTPASLR